MATTVREDGVWRQTRTLLLKNYLVKCRTKKSSAQVSKTKTEYLNAQKYGGVIGHASLKACPWAHSGQ